MQHSVERPYPGSWGLARMWAAIGLQSFGGGASTQLLIRRAFVENNEWIAEDEFARFWNLCQFSPGINLVALTILIGRKLGGTAGIAASLIGLLLPSGLITCALAAGYSATHSSAAVHAVLRGIVPATAGIMAVVGIGFARPLVARALDEGPIATGLSVAFAAAAALALTLFAVSALLVVLALAAAGAVLFAGVRGARLQGAGGEAQ